MATFVLQVEALTSLAIDTTSTPTENEVTQFLIDGVNEVTTKWLMISPQDLNLFLRESSEYTSNSSSPFTDEVEIVSVLREAGTNDDWRYCKEIPVGIESKITDSESIFYASKYNPAYSRNSNGVIKVFPIPASGGANSYKVLYVNNNIVNETNGAALIYSHSDIGFFPKKLENLVVIYAGLKCLEAQIAAYTIDDEDSELVASLSNSYNALKMQYDAMFGLRAKQIRPQQQESPEEQTQEVQESEEE